MKLYSIYFFIGLSAGIFSGLAGLGGGLVMIPLLVYVLKLSQHKAHGTSLVALVFTGISGAITYALNGAVDYTAAFLLAGTAVFTARYGAHYANSLPVWKMKKIFGVFLLFCAGLLCMKPFFTGLVGPVPVNAKILVLLTTGLVTGFLSGMMGVGGGIIMVPVMVLLAGFSQHVAQGTSLLVMIPTGTAGALAHLKLGNIANRLLIGLIPGIFLGTAAGGSFAYLLPDSVLRTIFAVVIIWTGLRYVRSRTPE